MKQFFFLAILFFTITTLPCRAQCLQDAVWCFGDSAGIDFSDTSNISVFQCGGKCFESSASIANCAGDLLFYFACQTENVIENSEFQSVYNRNHVVMENGDSLENNASTTQGALIIPFANNGNRFYIFHTEYNAPLTSEQQGLFYSIIDLSYNGNLGKVISKNIQLLDIPLNEKLGGVKHANGKDWWILIHSNPADTFIRYLVTENGIEGPYYQEIGNGNDTLFYDFASQMVFNNDGDKLAYIYTFQGVTVFDFDRCSGMLSNPKNYGQSLNVSDWDFYYGTAFSPNGRFLYLGYTVEWPIVFNYLFQFDLNSADPENEMEFELLNTQGCSGQDATYLGQFMLASNNKIYISAAHPPGWAFTDYCYTNTNLSVINEPNKKYPACDFQPFSFYLGGQRTHAGLPNMPNYNLGSIIPPTVDTGASTETCADQPVQLQAVSCSACIYDWQPPEFLSDANLANPIATVNSTTTFTLTVTDTSIHASCNKTSTDTITVFVTDNTPHVQTLYIVSAGDEFFLLQDLQPNTSLEIISVNGQRVYQTENYQNDLELKNLAAGMYYYKMNLPDCYEVEGKFVVVR